MLLAIEGSPTGRPLLVFVMELRFRRPNLVFTECTVNQEVALLQKWLGDLYQVESFIWSPAYMGWWVDRRRRYCVMVLKDGPFHLPFDVFNTMHGGFGAVFRKVRPENQIKGDMFLAAPSRMVKLALGKRLSSMIEKATEPGASAAPNGTWTWADTLDAAATTRLTCGRRLLLEKEFGFTTEEVTSMTDKEFEKVCSSICPRRPGFIDLNQNPAHMCTMSGAVPCLLSRFQLWSLAKKRLMIPEEAFLAQGLDTLGLGTFPSPYGSALHELSTSSSQDLAGNTVNLACGAAIVAYILSQLRPRHAAIPRAIPAAPDSLAIALQEEADQAARAALAGPAGLGAEKAQPAAQPPAAQAQAAQAVDPVPDQAGHNDDGAAKSGPQALPPQALAALPQAPPDSVDDTVQAPSAAAAAPAARPFKRLRVGDQETQEPLDL